MNSLNTTEQLLLASLLGVFVVGSGILFWQERKLDAQLSGFSPAPQKEATVKAVSSLPRVLSLAHASAQELEQLPGIGPKLAEEIVRYRQMHPFHTVEDLIEVPGIGPRKLEKIKDRLKVE